MEVNEVPGIMFPSGCPCGGFLLSGRWWGLLQAECQSVVRPHSPASTGIFG